MKLVPADPPGRSSRKARHFAQDIRELRDQGYTFEAIRMALAAVGVHVSNATVQREVARAVKGLGAASDGRPTTGPAPTPAASCMRTEADPRSGREIAEAFTATQNTNPLFRSRSPE
ncbi:hypothetical protein [Hydrogenophaga flava]|uniref:hypothetical protein n=1 Tax=Hydrogenophaga flava TaxID=65657 RepID=UPI000B1D1881|nr:hypothetical protein [Hydrogenophaga flava]